MALTSQSAKAPEFHGAVKPGFEKVRTAFLDNFSPVYACHETGATFSAYIGGEQVVQLWGGFADKARTRPWTEHTVVNIFSSTKGIAASCIAMLNARGEIDYRAKVTKYWPEFGQNGKENVTVAQMLSHQSGLSGLREPTTIDDVCNVPVLVKKLEAAAPLWEPGTVSGYHAITWGHLAGELVRRVTGKSLGTFLREELAGPLGADLFIGLKKDNGKNPIAEMIRAPGEQTQTLAEMSEILKLTLGNPVIEAEIANEPRWQESEIPAANGQGNAEGLARLYSIFANGGRFGGKSYVTPESIANATREVFRDVDINLGKVIGWGAGGFFLNNDLHWYGPNDEAFGHSGWGGSYGFADPKAHVGVGYVPNQMDTNLQGDPRAMRLIEALYDCL
ncbi:MAG TPA: serine hydrolase domain-containing protein [Rhizomicrobium sp.]|jgi:CubicO group peptidase (beta-lactamase class C family)